jgi:hypothetical protein
VFFKDKNEIKNVHPNMFFILKIKTKIKKIKQKMKGFYFFGFLVNI